MRIRVQRKDGQTETLELEGAWTVTNGKYLDRLTNGQGFDHFFTPDGYYDGWGASPPVGSDASEILDAIETRRELSD